MGCYESFMILWLAGLMLLLLTERIGMEAERKGQTGMGGVFCTLAGGAVCAWQQ